MNAVLEKQFTVANSESAEHIGSGELSVLSTPSMITYMENTAMEIAKEITTPEQTTVGIEINVQHLTATAVGKTVSVKATLESQKKSVLVYNIKVYGENNQEIGRAEHKRAIVNKDDFMNKLN